MNKTNPGVALVTGAFSGIGRATAKALQSAGFRVFGTSRRASAESVDGVTMLACDVTNDKSVAKLVDEVLAKAGRIDLLVNNAGVGLLGGARILNCTGSGAVRRERLRCYPRDQRGVAGNAPSRERQDCQSEFGTGLDSSTLFRALCVYQACH